MEVLSSRTLVRAADFTAAVSWYRDVLGLRVSREYGRDGQVTGVVFFLGGGFLEVVGGGPAPANPTPGRPRVGQHPVTLWLQVPDVDAEHDRLRQAGATVVRAPETEPWGLRECWIEGPDGAQIVLVEVPETHPIRRRLDV